ncbi:MAG TPA: gliding motility-associated C-terminal domain-containing protein, partial [Bacteroidetes bacterium]|nr:gliding motility-associated C-terminal domain-containing protein [Bacteroidota bacterium]
SGHDLSCAEVSTTEGATATFSVLVTNQWGCSSTETAEITTHTFDPRTRDFITICPNVPTPINPEAEGSDLQYIWTPSTGLDCPTCPNPVATLEHSQQYYVTVLGINGADTCTFGGTVNVLVNPLIEIATEPAPDTSLCEMTDVPLSATVVSPIVEEICWYENSPGNQIGCGSDITVSPDETVVYFAIATDTLGCRDTAMLTVNAYPIDVTLDEVQIFCEEDEVHLIEVTNNDPAQELTFSNWTDQQYIIDAAPDSSSITVDNVPAEQLFTVHIENQFGCTLNDSTTVLYFDLEPTVGDITSTMDTIYFNSGEFSQLGLTFTDSSYFYEWIPQEGLSDPYIENPQAQPSETTAYILIVSNEYDCMATRTDTIVVLNPDCGEPDIFLPNAFTPNGDGHNDVLYVRSNIIETMELSIYDRWGELIFHTTDQNTGWDGTYRNQRLAPDVFGFYLRAVCFNGQTYTRKGNVMILR